MPASTSHRQHQSPTAAPAALVNQPPLAARENFAFAPYWTLAAVAHLRHHGPVHAGLLLHRRERQRHARRERPGLERFPEPGSGRPDHAGPTRPVSGSCSPSPTSARARSTRSPRRRPPPATLSGALIPLLQAKSLDGVNFDFEGEGSGDQAGLTNLITSVAGSLRAADPHWQITMDTYASSAGDSGGFYNIPALGQVVDAFFVMDYELNLPAARTAASPLTSGMFSSLTTLPQYDAAVAGLQGHPRHAVLRHRLAHQQRDDGGGRSGRRRRHPRLAGGRATGPSTGTRSPTPRGRATRSAASGTSRTTRATTGCTTCRRW